MSTGVEQDAILLDAEKDLSNQFNAVLGATIAVCIVFLFSVDLVGIVVLTLIV